MRISTGAPLAAARIAFLPVLNSDAIRATNVLARLKAGWQEEFDRWKRRDLSVRRYVYIWADA